MSGNLNISKICGLSLHSSSDFSVPEVANSGSNFDQNFGKFPTYLDLEKFISVLFKSGESNPIWSLGRSSVFSHNLGDFLF